jgi:prepilin-type processing-associated H-X9-DG protein
LVLAILAILVVIVVILAIVGIAFPVWIHLDRGKNRVVALNTMRQLGSVAATYTAEYNGTLPEAGSKDPDTWAAAMDPENAKAWYNVLPKKLGHKGVDQYASNPQAFYSKENILFLPGAQYPDDKLARPMFAIAINTKLQRKDEKGEKPPVKLHQITHPARTVLFLEQGLPKEKKASAQQPKYDGSPNGSAKSFVARYGGAGVVTFVDGHAELVEGKDVLEAYGNPWPPLQPGDIIWSKTPEENPNK